MVEYVACNETRTDKLAPYNSNEDFNGHKLGDKILINEQHVLK